MSIPCRAAGSLWLLLCIGSALSQSMVSDSGILYPPDAIGTAALSVRDLTVGLCPTSSSGVVPVKELTIQEVRSALLSGRITCTQLVETYITRITVYNAATGLNAVRSLAVERALNASAALDAELQDLLQQHGVAEADARLPSLFCTPMLLKDNIDVPGSPTTAGAQALASNYPLQPAFVVHRLHQAGAIMLGKSNMGEFALFPSFTVGSLAGFTRNPYHLAHSPGGSSGGSAAAVSANFALAALGTDTGNSVRGPASHGGVVGMRPSIGLVSRTGVVPLRIDRDTVGPITRTVADAAALLGVMAGLDSDDAACVHELEIPTDGANDTTIDRPTKIPTDGDYTRYLDANALSHARIGIMREIVDIPGTDQEISTLFAAALYTMQSMGATLVDNFTIRGNDLGLDWDANRNGQGPALGHWNVDGHWSDLWACTSPLRSGMDEYLGQTNASGLPHNLAELYTGGGYHPMSRDAIVSALQAEEPSPADFPTEAQQQMGLVCGCDYWWKDPCRTEFRKNLVDSMDEAGVDVIVYPTWNDPPLKIGDSWDDYYDGNNSPMIAPQTGSPAISIPMGFTSLGLPAGLQFLARPFDEPTLFAIAYAYEQASNKRQSPHLFPDCASSNDATNSSSQAAG